ncbi:hypothetical protein AGMMS49941_05950 [Deferribacterales bacterium]|nr:hypothetical protein AGMMS49941_05950 [Deferribacterales bacterium]
MKMFLINLLTALIPSRYYRILIRSILRDDVFPAQYIKVHGPTDIGGEFKDYFINNNMPAKIKALKDVIDDKSKELVDVLIKRLLYRPKGGRFEDYKIRTAYLATQATQSEQHLWETYKEERWVYPKEFFLPTRKHVAFSPEAFTLHHGLRYASAPLKNYIADKDFIDGGAYMGESVLVLNKFYKPRKVYSFELFGNNKAPYELAMSKNNVPDDKYEFVQLGLSNKRETLSFSTQANSMGVIAHDTHDGGGGGGGLFSRMFPTPIPFRREGGPTYCPLFQG